MSVYVAFIIFALIVTLPFFVAILGKGRNIKQSYNAHYMEET